MQVTIDIYSRHDFIAFGTALGTFIATGKLDKAFLFSCGGDNCSGKSFLALCIDQVLDSTRYPSGLSDTLSADYMLRPFHASHLKGVARTRRLKTVFRNFSNHPQPYLDFDKSLVHFRSLYAHAQAIALSNPPRDRKGHNYAADSLASQQLDLHVHFKILPGPFARQLTLTFDNPALLPVFEPFQLFSLDKPQPYSSFAFTP